MAVRRATLLLVLAAAGACTAPALHGDEPAPEDPSVDVAPIVARRLNRSEYDHTVRDLLGTSLQPALEFPADERGLGFDNVAELLVVSPESMALFERAAERLAAEVMSDPERRARLVPCDATDLDEGTCAAAVVDAFVPRAFRRPLRPEERQAFLDLYAARRAEGDDLDAAIEAVVQAVLMSPQFLYRIEEDPDLDACRAHPVSDWELASRLSYFLWSSMPDDALFAAAADGTLHDVDVLEAEVERMLDDPRAEAFVHDFAGQWLYIRALDDVFKDVTRYPEFDEELRAAMKAEMVRFFASFLVEDRDLRELLTADATTIEPPLAKVYGIAVEPFEGVRPLDLTSLPRRGVLTMPGLMAALARPFRTAPVKRGAWVLGQLMCAKVPPPPPGVEGFGAAEDDESPKTARERLAVHGQSSACAGCHAAMDPIGLALEPYDAIGAFRRRDGDATIDPSGTLVDGRSFADAVELAQLVAEDPAFLDCVARQTLTYALGRGLEASDEEHVDEVVRAVIDEGYSTRALLTAVVRSEPFRYRRCEDGA